MKEIINKSEFIKKFSKIEQTFEYEFKAEFNSPELIWEALKEQLIIGVVPRFFVDLRSGCGAVRDRLHLNFNPDYPGLHNDTIDVVEYRHGFQNSETNSWDMYKEDIDFLNERCDSLNANN